MKLWSTALAATAGLVFAACGGEAQQSSDFVRSSDPELREIAAGLMEDLAQRSALELKEPVVLERRTREQLVRYLEHKLDEELSESEAERTVRAYALLGLVPPDLDLRSLLMDLYTEQVAGFYDPDSTALFVMDDQPREALEGLLLHELVHAVQDQSADLAALTDPSVGNDRQIAAQAAIEGHATLVMLELMAERMTGAPIDLAAMPDFATSALAPALQAMGQFPALANSPPIIQQELLFPYVEGAGFVQGLWARAGRVAPFGEHLPRSTEQVMEGEVADEPVDISLAVRGGTSLDEDGLGAMETAVFLETHVGASASDLARAWGGDRYALVEAGGETGLSWVTVWDDTASRDRFVELVRGVLDGLGGDATVGAEDVSGHPGARIEVDLPGGVVVVATAGG